MYQKLINDPWTRDKITHSHVYWDGAFTVDELDHIDYICSKERLEESVTFGADSVEDVRRHRLSKVRFFNRNQNTDWIFKRFNEAAESLNDQFYNFNLNGYESFQYTVYFGDERGRYDWHMDAMLGGDRNNTLSHLTRKLTMVLLLNEPGKDFTGGEFQINQGDQNAPQTIDIAKGRIIAFPSFLIHRVCPVLSGVRKSIVIWIEGPKFV